MGLRFHGALAVAACLSVIASLSACGGGASGTASSGLSAVGGTASSCTRPYADSSPWNTPIPPGTPAGPTEALSGVLTSDPSQYTYPVYEVDSTVPRRPVTTRLWFSNVVDGGTRLQNERAGVASIPIPEGAVPADGFDSQIIILDRQTGDEWGAFRLKKRPDGTWEAENAYHYNTAWSGVPPRDSENKPFFSRGAGVPYLTGLVRPCEISRGRIDHALAFAYDYASPSFVFPATKSDGIGDPAVDLPEGSRLQLDPTLTAEALALRGCTGACLTIATALQTYGMYVIDNSRRPKLILEFEGTAGWSGLVSESTVSPIPLSAFRLVGAPPRPATGATPGTGTTATPAATGSTGPRLRRPRLLESGGRHFLRVAVASGRSAGSASVRRISPRPGRAQSADVKQVSGSTYVVRLGVLAPGRHRVRFTLIAGSRRSRADLIVVNGRGRDRVLVPSTSRSGPTPSG